MKRTHVPKGEVVFIGGRRVRWSQSKRGGVNFYTDDDCPVVVGEASEVVDCRERISRLEGMVNTPIGNEAAEVLFSMSRAARVQ